MRRQATLLIACAMLLCAGCATEATARDEKGARPAPPPAAREAAPTTPAAEASTDGGATWTASSVVRSTSAFRITYYWSKGPRLRAETMIGVRPVVTIVAGDRYWVYDELGRTGLEIERAPAAIREDAERDRPFADDLAQIIELGGELVETSAIDGVPVEIWRLTNSVGRRTVWVTASEPKLPVRVENFDRESGQIATLEYSGWRRGTPLPDRAFAPPGDLELQRYDYESFLRTAVENETLGRAPVLYPRLLHGPRPE